MLFEKLFENWRVFQERRKEKKRLKLERRRRREEMARMAEKEVDKVCEVISSRLEKELSLFPCRLSIVTIGRGEIASWDSSYDYQQKPLTELPASSKIQLAAEIVREVVSSAKLSGYEVVGFYSSDRGGDGAHILRVPDSQGKYHIAPTSIHLRIRVGDETLKKFWAPKPGDSLF